MDAEVVWATIVGLSAALGALFLTLKIIAGVFLQAYEEDLRGALEEAATPSEIAIARRNWDRFQALVNYSDTTRRPY